MGTTPRPDAAQRQKHRHAHTEEGRDRELGVMGKQPETADEASEDTDHDDSECSQIKTAAQYLCYKWDCTIMYLNKTTPSWCPIIK